jgi:hypothetical protein
MKLEMGYPDGLRIRLADSLVFLVQGELRVKRQGLFRYPGNMVEAIRIHLYLVTGPHAGDEFRVSQEAVLGRQEGNEVRLDDKKASRRHAKVFREGEAVYLQDLGSSNGTYIGEDRISRVRLRDGDVFRIGETKVRVRLEATQVSSPDAAASHTREGMDQEAPSIQVRETPKPRGGGISSVEVKTGRSGRLLQYHKIEDRGGLFSEDLSQRGAFFKFLLFLALLALGAILFFFAFEMGSGGK